MSDENKHNLLYFDSDSMRGLYEILVEWQQIYRKRLLSTNIQQDKGRFCCIALSNPTEVILCDGSGGSEARVYDGQLLVQSF